MKRLLLFCLFLAGLFSPEWIDAQVSESQRNYTACLHGYHACDQSKLTEGQKTEVRRVALERNYSACLHGHHGCDPSKLTEPERRDVQQASLQRNYNACLHGYHGCDESKLTDSQQRETRQAEFRRNYNACLHGYHGCDPSKLTDAEKGEVQQANDERNLTACLRGYPSCDQSRLTAAQKESLPKSVRSAPDGPNDVPRYYTNSQGERVQSPTYYPSAPAGATAQCRDGTFSFSRNHRGTCSHHGGVSKWLD